MNPFRPLIAALALILLTTGAQSEPLHIVIDGGVIEPMPVAVPDFIAENGGADKLAHDIARVVRQSLPEG